MTVLPVATSVIVNTAPAEVIAALVPGLSLSQARAMTGERDRGNWFNNAGDFANRLAGTGVEGPAPTVTTASGWFLASGTVVYERARVSMQALVRSAPPAAPALPTRMRRKIGTDAPCAPIARRPRPPGHGGMALPPMAPSSWPL
ncbi:hypothetical protein G6F68_013998 [Rhizopus microsporus]|nr:hypothetical protein G6F68_013998 [Rhizopus microsporus]